MVAEARAPFGSLYHHFPGGKQQLADEVIRAAGAFFAALVTAVYDQQATTEASVRAVFTGAAETLASALEGAFVLCRAERTVEPMLAAGEMAAAYAAASGRRPSGP